jgi:hypothetical protein
VLTASLLVGVGSPNPSLGTRHGGDPAPHVGRWRSGTRRRRRERCCLIERSWRLEPRRWVPARRRRAVPPGRPARHHQDARQITVAISSPKDKAPAPRRGSTPGQTLTDRRVFRIRQPTPRASFLQVRRIQRTCPNRPMTSRRAARCRCLSSPHSLREPGPGRNDNTCTST